MTVQIVGAGMAGTYLGKLLDNKGYDFEIYEIRKKPMCHCAWGLIYSMTKGYVKKIGYNLDDYILTRPKRVLINDIETKVNNVVIFDRPKWLGDLWDDLKDHIMFEEFKKEHMSKNDLIVDASGTSRVVMSMYDGCADRSRDTLLITRENRIKNKDLDENYIYIYAKSHGYAWGFPLGDNVWHIGAGAYKLHQVKNLLSGLFTMLNKEYDILDAEIICGCKSYVRHIVPGELNVIYHTPYPVAAIGEAGGFVSAYGEGNELAMETAYILYQSIEKNYEDFYKCIYRDILNDYKEMVLKHTEWIADQHEFVRAMNKSFWSALFKIRKTLKIAKKRSNIKLGGIKGLKVLWSVCRR